MDFEIMEKDEIPGGEYVFVVAGRKEKEKPAWQPFWVEIDERERERNAKDEFSIEESDVVEFLRYFLLKYFDAELSYNRNRELNLPSKICEFEWYDANYYTYETMEKMFDELVEVAKLLRKDFYNPRLECVKEYFPRWFKENPKESEKIADFYIRFAERLWDLMHEYEDVTLIAVVGP